MQMNKINVLIIGQLPKEAYGSYTTGICNVVYELSKQNFPDVSLTVLATNAKDADVRKLSSDTCNYIGNKIRPLHILFRILGHPLKSLKEWKSYRHTSHVGGLKNELYKDSIIRAIEETKPDLIHVMNGIQTYPLHYADNKPNVPIIQTYHGVFMRDQNDLDLAKGAFPLIDFATGLTPETKSDLVSLGYPSERIALIPNGTNVKQYYFDDEERKTIRTQMGCKDGQVVFVTVGSLQERKGQYKFVQYLKNVNLDFQYWIIGGGIDYQKIDSFIKENNLEEKVKLLGYKNKEELYKYYSAADIYAHMSTAEGQALSEVEAYATDLKIVLNKQILGTVVTDTTNTRDYFIFDYTQDQKIDFENWCKEIKSNRNTRGKYDWSAIAKMYAELYQKIITHGTV